MPDHCCIGCQTPDVDPIYPVCDACRRLDAEMARVLHTGRPKDFLAALPAGRAIAQIR